MKKLKLFALGLLSSSLVLTSCQEDDDDVPLGPALTVEVTSATVTDGEVVIAPGENVSFTWVARRGDADLQDFTIKINGNAISGQEITNEGNDLPYLNIAASDNENYTDGVTITFSGSGSQEIEFEVVDEDGLTASQSYTITLQGPAQLSSPQSFQWVRANGNNGTGLAQFGLAWENNTATNAIVKKDGSVTLVKLSASDWALSGVAELSAAIDAQTDIGDYRGISVVSDRTYTDEYLGVRFNDKVYILRINNSTVTGSSPNFTFTVNGDFKAEQ